MAKSPARIAEMVAEIRRHRTTDAPFEVAVDGYSEAGDSTLPRAYGAAGATRWLESLHGMRGPLDEMMTRVEAGPRRLNEELGPYIRALGYEAQHR